MRVQDPNLTENIVFLWYLYMFRARPFDTPKFLWYLVHVHGASFRYTKVSCYKKNSKCCTLLLYEVLRHMSIYQYINNKQRVDE